VDCFTKNKLGFTSPNVVTSAQDDGNKEEIIMKTQDKRTALEGEFSPSRAGVYTLISSI
jgi:hypothetical protein